MYGRLRVPADRVIVGDVLVDLGWGGHPERPEVVTKVGTSTTITTASGMHGCGNATVVTIDRQNPDPDITITMKLSDATRFHRWGEEDAPPGWDFDSVKPVYKAIEAAL